jgi:hypothetical protein
MNITIKNDIYINKIEIQDDNTKLINFNIYLLKNPDLIYKSINDNIYLTEFDCQFIKINIYEIFKDTNIRNTLLNFFCNKYINTSNNTIKIYIASNIQLLLCKSLNYDGDIDIKNHNKLGLIGKNSIYTIKNLMEILNEIIKNNTIEEYINYIIINKDNILNNDKKKYYINKYFKNDNIIYNNDDITINNINYTTLELNQNNLFVKLFCNNMHYLFLHSDNELLLLTDDFFMKFIIIKNNIKYTLNKIYFNDNEIIPYNDVIAPFKYIIPQNYIYLIYKKNNAYNITYFINNKFQTLKENM